MKYPLCNELISGFVLCMTAIDVEENYCDCESKYDHQIFKNAESELQALCASQLVENDTMTLAFQLGYQYADEFVNVYVTPASVRLLSEYAYHHNDE